MKKQITLILIILITLTSCGTKKSISSSSLENNIMTQIDDSININSSSNIKTETTNIYKTKRKRKKIIKQQQ